ncbi:hypothetical protein PVBG_02435 [Plasmodium vivax Brazil I]|nr:hypothetical protein PVBG_02435 [Plasmodium vivax Brazil I]
MLYDDFYVKDSKSNFINECNALDNHEKTHKGVKELCMKLVSSLDKLSKMETISQERKDRCDYLSYWLYDEIGKIYNVHSSKINTVQFVKDLIGVGNEVNKKNIKNNTCTIKTDSSISLDEWKKRKYFYIYFKKHNELSSDVNRSNNYKCSKHNKYLKSIDSLYKTYYKATCTGWFFGGNTDYFKCDTNLNPNVLLPKVEKCQVSRSSSGGGGGFLGSWFGVSSSRGSTASQAGETRQTQASATAGKAGPQAQETRAGNVGSTQDAKLAAVPRESRATPINMERQPIPEKQSRHSIEQNQQV